MPIEALKIVFIVAAAVFFLFLIFIAVLLRRISVRYKQFNRDVLRYERNVLGVLMLVLSRIDCGLIMLSDDGLVELVNDCAASVTGCKEKKPPDFFTSDMRFAEILQQKKPATDIFQKDGREYLFSFEFEEFTTILISDITTSANAERIIEYTMKKLNDEIIAPLATVTGYAELIKNGISGENAKNAAATIAAESKKVSAAVKNILAITNKQY